MRKRSVDFTLLLCLCACLCLFGIAFEPTARGQSFTESPAGFPGVRSGSLAWGDYDNDGDLDVLLAGETGSGQITRIYRNDRGVFTDLAAGLPGISDGTVAWGDYNGDGNLDLAITGMSAAGRISRVYRNNPNGTFTDINAGLPGLEASTIAWGDYDNDGDLDFFLTGYTGSAYLGIVYRNDGGDPFADSGVTAIRGGANGSASWTDFDNDGDLDLLYSGFTLDTSSGQSSRLYRNSNGAFVNFTGAALTAMSENSAAWGDYDNDDDLDLLMAGSSIAGVQSFPTVRLYRNNSGGAGFTSITSTGMGGAQHCSVAWGDIDNDGDLDAAIAGYDTSFQGSARIYRNEGGGFFTDLFTPLTGVFEAALAWGDFDNDGDLDLLLSGHTGTGTVTRLFRNHSPVPNSAPGAPINLLATTSGKVATLSWAGSGDANQSGGATFNLRVGTASGLGNIASPMAHAVSGTRRLAAMGNMNQNRSWTLNLPVGAYFWSVQAIDHGLAGSPFAPEQTFVIPPQAPSVTTLPATNVTGSAAVVRGGVNPNGVATEYSIEYGITTNYGWTTPARAIGAGVTEIIVSEALTDLLSATTYHYRVVASNSLGVSHGINRSFSTPLFAEILTPDLLGVGGGSVAWGDYDNDGDLDLLVAGANSSAVHTRLYRNESGSFVDAQVALPGIHSGTVAWGDYDRDGDLDILLTGNFLSRVYRNDGGNVFTDLNLGLPALSTGASGAWADFDSDGDLDFAITGAGGLPVKTYRNDGAGRFDDLTNSLPRLSQSAMAWADYDRDGDMDLLVSGYNYGSGGLLEMTRLFRNEGRGSFVNSNVGFQSAADGSLAWGDYDNDGDLDILLTGGTGLNRYSMIYSNNGGGGFVSVSITASVARMDHSSVGWGDYDNDGDLDFVAAGMTSTGAVTKLYRNDGGTLFRDSGATLPILSSPAVAWGDYDNDGRLDLVLSGYTGSNYVTRIYRNLSGRRNNPPGEPTELSESVVGNSVTLSWLGAPDLDQPAGLTYNARVGTAPGLADVLGPMAHGPSGFRLVPALGNAGVRRNATLHDLTVGTYYWSVQAVDNAFAGSRFSTGGSFTVSAALLKPTAISVTATNIGLDSATLLGTANPKGAQTFVFFQFGTSTNLGSVVGWRDIGSGITHQTLSHALSDLADGTVYFFRFGASNVNGVTFGATLSWTTRLQFSDVATALPPIAGGFNSWPGAAAWADADNDGDLDVAVSGLGLAATQLFRNEGGDVFALANASLPPAHYGTLEWGDYDNDGDADLLIGGSPSLEVARNNGDGSFSLITTNHADLYGTEFATWVDYDGDGDLDISSYDHVGSNAASAQARLYRNDNGVFVASGIPMPKLTAGWMAWADYDEDGDPDLALTGQVVITNQIYQVARIYRNDGPDGEFTDIAAPLIGLEDGRIAWGDVDNDGDPDLLLNGATPSELRTRIYLNDHGTFAEANSNLPGATGPATWIDYDNDGDLDVMLQQPDPNGSYTTNRIFRNTGSGTFTNSAKFILYIGRHPSFAWADYDRDGDLDVLVAGSLRKNNLLLPNPPPGPPGGLSSSRTGNFVTLQWNPPADANQSGGFTYSLLIGTAAGIDNVQSGLTEPGTGWRRIPKPGHAASPIWKMNLPVGEYHWRVQAIDHGLAGSAFSAESSFTIPVMPPQAVTHFITTNTSGHPTVHGSINPNGLSTAAYVEYGGTNFEFRTGPQTFGDGTAWLNLSTTLNGLAPERTYFYRVAASNNLGTRFGVTRSFFRPHFSQPSGTLAGHSWADFDQDGDLDVLYGSVHGNSLFRNDNGVLTNLYLALGSSGEGAPAWGDIDNDGDLDLLVSGRDSSFNRQSKIYRNEGNQQFTLLPIALTGVYQSAAAWADLDNDGDLDLLLTGADSQNSPMAQLLFNEGTNGFATARHSLTAVMRGAVACADYDSDGDVDVLMAGATKDGMACQLYRNEGGGVLTDSGAVFPGIVYGALSWGDYDDDGDPDILLNGGLMDSSLVARVYRNDNGSFVDAGVDLPGLMGGSAWVDYDNDGRLDIVLKGRSSVFGNFVRFFRNLGNGLFTDASLTLGPPGDPSATLIVGDYDNDGDLDLGFGQDGVLRNEGNVPNAPPHSPSGLEASIAANSAVLKWNSASDPNQGGGLTYNVRVGTSPGAGDVVSGMTIPGTGRRLAPEMGNAFGRLDFRLRHLRVGNYYWSVQTIDHAHAASPFSPEGTFAIPIQAPSIVPLSISNLLGNSATLNARVNPNGAAAVVYFEFGLTTNYGMQTSPVNIGSGTSPGVVSALVGGLKNVTGYHYRPVASNSLGVSHGADAVFATPQFTEVDLGLPAAPGSIAPGDYDNDGDLDFLLAVHSGSPTLLFRNNEPGGFSDSGMTFPALNGASLDWGDYDRDGDLDLLLLGFNATRIYRNDQGTLVNTSANLPQLWGTGRWGDHDNDGDLDVLISTGGNCKVYRNQGGDFALEHDLPGVGGYAVWGDYDNDGDLDIASCGVDENGDPAARLIRNDGLAGFKDGRVPLPRLFGKVAWGDCDNDGDLDLLLSGSTNLSVTPSGLVRIYRNEGAGLFSELPTTLPNVNGNILWADFDNDGDLDVLTSGLINWPRHAGVFRNDGNGTFTDINADFIPVSGDGLACGDFDKDGDLDFLLAGYKDPNFVNVARLYRNHNATSNGLPNSPTGLTVSLSSNAVSLEWSAASDPNQSGGLGYNLRVGTSSGAGDVISPMAEAGSGWRKVPGLGNVQQNRRWTVRNVEPGRTYYWSVQAVDHSFAGSVFAPEQSFFFNNAPVAQSQVIVLAEDTTVAVTLAGSDVDGQPLGYTVLAPPTNGVLGGVPPALWYRPQTNFFGADRIIIQVHDGFTNSAPAVVSLIITPVTDQSLPRVALERLPGGLPRLTVAGEPFERYAIEASEDLAHWIALPGWLEGDGLDAIIDSDGHGTEFPWRFYRAAMVPPVARINSAQWFAGTFRMNIEGALARRFTIEASTNLRDWASVTNLVLTTSPLSYTDPDSGDFSNRFYRVRPAP